MIGPILRTRRLDLSIPAKRIAAEMGIDQPTLSHLERKDIDIRLSTLKRWAQALGLKIVLVNTDIGIVERPCRWCKKPFKTVRVDRMFCQPCRKAGHHKKYRFRQRS